MATELTVPGHDPAALRVYDPEAFHVYDTTLRDGTQQEGLSLSVADKLAVARNLDELGVGFIEGGWPGSNPKDAEFFRRARTELQLSTATLTAFGATRRAHAVAADDPQVAALRDAGTAVVCLVAKADVRHVERALRTTPAENLAMIRDTVAHLRAEGQRVFVDAEHFFDGYAADPAYALEMVRTSMEAGAEVVVLCDTNGGMLPGGLVDVVGAVVGRDRGPARHPLPQRHGLRGREHARRRRGRGDPRAGHRQRLRRAVRQRRPVQRRRGPRDQAVPAGAAGRAGSPNWCASRTPSTRSRTRRPDPKRPYVGATAFAHKAGLHASAIKVDPDLYQHMDPATVGNDMRMLVSELAGRATIELKGRELGMDLSGEREALGRVVEQVKDLESQGFVFEAAEASLRAAAPPRGGGREALLPARVLAGHRRAARRRRDQ